MTAYAAVAAGIAQLVVPRKPSLLAAPATALLLAPAGVLGAGAVLTFMRWGTTVDPFHADRASTLITDGPNSVTRNPMYVALALVLTAHACWRGRLRAMLPVALYVLVTDRYQIADEERALEKLFGEEYQAYRASVPRWV